MQTPTKSSSNTTDVDQKFIKKEKINEISYRNKEPFSSMLVLGFPPTTLKITTNEDNTLEPDQIDRFLVKLKRDGKDGHVLLTSVDSYLKIEFNPSDPSILTLLFKKDKDTSEIKSTIPFKPIVEIPNSVINAMNLIVQRNDVNQGIREKDDISEEIYTIFGVDKRYSKEYLPKKDINANVESKSFTNPLNSNISSELVILKILPGSYLYRGIGDRSCENIRKRDLNLEPFTFFTHEEYTSKVYANLSNCVEIYEVTAEISLVDFWSGSFLKNFIDLNQYSDFNKNIIKTLFGTNRVTKNFLNEPSSRRQYKSIFEGGIFTKTPTGSLYFEYNGLNWGPYLDFYKRESDKTNDSPAFQLLLDQTPPDIDGFFCLSVPSNIHRDINPNNVDSELVYRFHSEIIIRNPQVFEKLKIIGRKQLGNTIGSGRKTYRKKKSRRKTIRSPLKSSHRRRSSRLQ